MSQPILTFDQVCLDIALKGKRSNFWSNTENNFRVLDNVSFELRKGDRVGVLGKNGAGKTTLLKVASGVVKPTSGGLQSKGSVFPVLKLGAGIVAPASCLQNIRLRGLYFGLKGAGLNVYIENVLKVADIDEFLYSPYSVLSEGMKSRLLVSMLYSLTTDVLLIDEWISAFDRTVSASNKSALNTIVDSAGVVMMASHNEKLIRYYCNKALVLSKGKITFFGNIDEGFDYLRQS